MTKIENYNTTTIASRETFWQLNKQPNYQLKHY
jgi:hypothetical protein